MKTLRQFSLALMLGLAFTSSAIAGDITTGVTSPPPPAPSSVAADGDITTGLNGEISTTAQASDSVVDIALSLVQSVLALF